MLLDTQLELAGGINNVTRILAPQGQVVLALKNPPHAPHLPDDVSLQSVLGEWQLSVQRTAEVSDQQLATIGKAIAERQKRATLPYQTALDCPYRPLWHISPPQGLLNDPNGFIYHQGEYHLFYQWHPFACEHKDKYWVHLKSLDLVHWQWQSVALTPSDWFDSHGVFSGHAVSHQQDLWLFYTGNTRLGAERQRQTMQCTARMSANGEFEKLGPVIRCLPEGVTEHIRDPKVMYTQGKWQMLLGAQTLAHQGRLAVYHSDDLLHWHFDKLYGDELGDYGYMWECPDWFELQGEAFFVFGPQGIASANPHHTIEHQNRIFRATQNAQGEIALLQGWPLDEGFDFYAPQTAQTADGRRVLCGWMGLPDETQHPSCDQGWIHQLTALRELEWREGKIYQHPLRELDTLRSEPHTLLLSDTVTELEAKSFDLQVTLPWGCELRLMQNAQYRVTLTLDAENQLLRLDRSATQIRQGDTIRELKLDSPTVELRILADQSSLEIFINQGEHVMTSRIFTPQDASGISLHGASVDAKLYYMAPASAPFNREVNVQP
ncbi:glycoside hydrolase family 32 protein [Vibrio cholerae]|nr:glycoside hydrolase family 32 protein [Vibrio cholerae]